MDVKRPVILFLGSTILGIIIAYSETPAAFKLLLIAIAIFLYLKLYFEGKINFKVLLAVLIFALLGFYRFKVEDSIFNKYEKNVESLGKGNKIMTGKIESIGKSTNSNYYIISDCEVSGIKLGTCRCYFNDENNPNIKIGNFVRVTAGTTINESPLNEGEFNQKNYYRSCGISFISFGKEFTIVNEKYNKLKQGIYTCKILIKDQILKIFNQKDAGLFSAMITGDKSTIDKEQKRLFSDNGIAHILAISGLHLSILGLFLFELLRKRFSINFSAGVVSIFILLYGIFIDAGATSLRAISMLYIRFLSLSIGRTYDSKNTLYIICFVFLMLHPYLLFNVGFQFSYVAIFALNENVSIYIKKKPKIETHTKDNIKKSKCDDISYINKKIKVPAIIVLTIFLFPITIYHYFTYPLYSIILNLLVIPLMSFVLGFGIASLLISFLYVPFGQYLAIIVHLIFLLYDKLCYFIEGLPCHLLWLGKPDIYELLFYYVSIFLIIYALKENIKVKRSSIRSILCTVLLVLSVLIMSIRPHYDFRMTFLSIGQGDASIIEASDTVITIDGGSSSNTNAGQYIETPHIKSRAINHIDYAFVSHPDSDHINSLLYMIESEDELKIKKLILPINGKIDPAFDKLKNSAIENGVEIMYLGEGDSLNIKKDLYVEVLSPDNYTIDRNFTKKKKDQFDVNELSLVFKLTYKDKSVLFTGDIGKKNISRMLSSDSIKDKLKSDILKVPHHGSKNSLNEDFYKIVAPEVAVISYGKGNTYGHPHQVVLDALKNDNIDIYKTPMVGQVDFYFTDKGTEIKTYR